MKNSDDRHKDDDNITQLDADRILAHKLLSEEERRYFSGEDNSVKSSKIRFFKRRHASASIDHNSTNTSDMTIINHIATDKRAVISAQQNRGAETLIATIVLILFVSAAGLFLFNADTPDKSLVEAVSSLKETEMIESLNEEILLNVDDLAHNNDGLALVDESSRSLDTNFDSEQPKTAMIAATYSEDALSNTVAEITPKQTDSIAVPTTNINITTAKTELPEQQSAISFEEFAADAQVTVYREE